MRQRATRSYIDTLRELTEQGREVRLPIAGGSMVPFLVHNRDSVLLRKPDRPLKVGDIVLYQRRDGRYVLHRIRRIRQEGYYLIGDAQRETEGPLDREQIFALVIGACRKGRQIGPGDFWWEFFARVWIRMVPLRRFFIRSYTVWKGGSHG